MFSWNDAQSWRTFSDCLELCQLYMIPFFMICSDVILKYHVPSGYLTQLWKPWQKQMIFPAIKLHLVHGFSIAMLVITRWCIWCMILAGFNPQDDPSQLIRLWFRQNMSKPCHPTKSLGFLDVFSPKLQEFQEFHG